MYNPKPMAVENRTRQNKSYGVDWVVNVFGCSTLTWYERFINGDDFSSGFLNRFVFYLHEQQKVKSRFKPVDKTALGLWQEMLKGTCNDSIQLPKPKSFKLSKEAFDEFEVWFYKVYEYLIADPEDVKREASARIIVQVLKLSLVYAVFSNTDEVTKDQFLSAQAVGQYWGRCSGMTLDEMEFDRKAKAEQIVLRAIAKGF